MGNAKARGSYQDRKNNPLGKQSNHSKYLIQEKKWKQNITVLGERHDPKSFMKKLKGKIDDPQL